MMMLKKLCCTKNMSLGLLALRLAVGIPFVAHGWSKLAAMEQTGAFFVSLGMPAFMGGVIGVLELVSGLALVLGMGTMIAGYVLAAIMLVAILLVKGKMGYLGGFEFDLTLLLAAVAVANLGCGSHSACAMMKGKMASMKTGGGCCGMNAKESCCGEGDAEHKM